MIATSTDKAVYKAFAKPEDKGAFGNAMLMLLSSETKEAFSRLHSVCGVSKSQEIPLRLLEHLINAKLRISVEYLLIKYREFTQAFGIDDILRVATSAKCLNAWIGSGDAGKEKTRRLERLFRDSPPGANRPILAAWFFETSVPSKLGEGVGVFLEEDFPGDFIPQQDLLKVALSRDKDGAFMGALVSAIAGKQAAWERFSPRLMGNAELLSEFLQAFPKSAEKIRVDPIIKFTRLLFQGAAGATGPAQRLWCARLLALAAAAMEQPPHPSINALLTELDGISVLLAQNDLPGTCNDNRTTLRFGGCQRENTGAGVTSDGAQLIALTLDQFERGENPVLALQATAFNLGMRGLAKVDSVLPFDPRLHEDISGGALSGDKISIISCGWTLEERLISRAKVKLV